MENSNIVASSRRTIDEMITTSLGNINDQLTEIRTSNKEDFKILNDGIKESRDAINKLKEEQGETTKEFLHEIRRINQYCYTTTGEIKSRLSKVEEARPNGKIRKIFDWIIKAF